MLGKLDLRGNLRFTVSRRDGGQVVTSSLTVSLTGQETLRSPLKITVLLLLYRYQKFVKCANDSSHATGCNVSLSQHSSGFQGKPYLLFPLVRGKNIFQWR